MQSVLDCAAFEVFSRGEGVEVGAGVATNQEFGCFCFTLCGCWGGGVLAL